MLKSKLFPAALAILMAIGAAGLAAKSPSAPVPGASTAHHPAAARSLISLTSLVTPAPGNYYKLVNLSNGGCLDDYDGLSSVIADDACLSGDGLEKWLLQSTTQSGNYKLVNLSSGGCVTQAGGDALADACQQGDGLQKWGLYSTPQAGYYKLVNLTTGQCLDDAPGGDFVDNCTQGADGQKFGFQLANV